jgi:hypothetical protein
LKSAKVIPVFKSGDQSLVTNYRPISILNSFSKVFEKALYNRLLNFIDKNNILFSGQFGFRKGHSTAMALVAFMDKLTELLDNNQFVIGMFIDLSKAFDTIDHSIMIRKLSHYGVRGLFLDLISNYLSGRAQCVYHQGHLSSAQNVQYGVQQESILGPLLFIFILMIYIDVLKN